MSEGEHILRSVDDRVLTLTFNRPEKRNALTQAMYSALAEAIHSAQENPAIRAILLTGAGGAFTSGNDVKDFMQSPPTGEDSPTFRFLAAIVGAEKPLVAAVEGAAVGIGTTMLLHCDLVYASAHASFHMPFVNLGLNPEAASSFLLPRIMGHQRAAELLLLGRRFDPKTAYSAGLVNDVMSPGEALPRAMEASRELAELPPGAVRLTKHLMKTGTHDAVLRALRREGKHFLERLKSPEAAEAFTAFLQKRKPDFSRFE